MARKILTVLDFNGIPSENFAVETLTGSATTPTTEGSLYIDGRAAQGYPNKMHFLAYDLPVGAQTASLENFTIATEQWANNTFAKKTDGVLAFKLELLPALASVQVVGSSTGTIRDLYFDKANNLVIACIGDSVRDSKYYRKWEQSNNGYPSSDELQERAILFVEHSVYKYVNDAWVCLHEGASAEDLSKIKELIGAANDDNILDNWAEAKRFLDSYTGDGSLSSLLSGKVTANAAITANTDSYRFPQWDTKGLVTGSKGTAYAKTMTFNGTAYGNIIRTTNADLPSFYAPTSKGTAGQVLVSDGSNTPVWGSRAKTTLLDTNTSGDVTWSSSNTLMSLKGTYNFGCNVKLYQRVSGKQWEWEEVIAEIRLKESATDIGKYNISVAFAKSQTARYRIVITD